LFGTLSGLPNVSFNTMVKMSSGIALVVSAGTLVFALGCDSAEPKEAEVSVTPAPPVVAQLAQQVSGPSGGTRSTAKHLVGPVIEGLEQEHEKAEELGTVFGQIFTDKSLLKDIAKDLSEEDQGLREHGFGMNRLVRMTRHFRDHRVETSPSLLKTKALWQQLGQQGFEMAIHGYVGFTKNPTTGLAVPAYKFGFANQEAPSVPRKLGREESQRPTRYDPDEYAKAARKRSEARELEREEEFILDRFATDELSDLMSNPNRVAGKAVGKIYMQARAITLSEDMCLSCHSDKKLGDPLAVMVYAIRKKE
jgi:hypothetical protein